MKKLTAISLLLVIFINQLGSYFYYAYQQYRIRREIKQELLANLPDSELEVFIEEDCRNEIVWEEYGEEFHYNNEMYDVAHVVVKDGKRFLYCINDKKEKKLLDRLVKLVESGGDARKHNRSGKNVVKFQLTDFEPPVSEFSSDISFYSKPHYTRFTAPLLRPVMEIKGPPPKA